MTCDSSKDQIRGQDALIHNVDNEEDNRIVIKLHKKRALFSPHDDLVKKQQKTIGMPQPFHFERNIKSVKGLEMMCGCKDNMMMSFESFKIVCLGLPLKRLGLFLKPEYALGDDDEESSRLCIER